jgi:hypothetical protein
MQRIQRLDEKELIKGLIMLARLKMYRRVYFSLSSADAVLFSCKTKGITIKACMKALQHCLRNLFALMFIIHPGMNAELQIVYKRMSQAIRLPEMD